MIAEIKAIRNGGEYPRVYYREAIDKALEIVDSQAQKIAEQAKRIEILEKCYYAAMNRFAFDSEENRGAWYEAQNNKRDSEGFTVET